MKEELESYKNKAHILEKQLDQAERHIKELKEIVNMQNEIIDHQIKEVDNKYKIDMRVESSSNLN